MFAPLQVFELVHAYKVFERPLDRLCLRTSLFAPLVLLMRFLQGTWCSRPSGSSNLFTPTGSLNCLFTGKESESRCSRPMGSSNLNACGQEPGSLLAGMTGLENLLDNSPQRKALFRHVASVTMSSRSLQGTFPGIITPAQANTNHHPGDASHSVSRQLRTEQP